MEVILKGVESISETEDQGTSRDLTIKCIDELLFLMASEKEKELFGFVLTKEKAIMLKSFIETLDKLNYFDEIED